MHAHLEFTTQYAAGACMYTSCLLVDVTAGKMISAMQQMTKQQMHHPSRKRSWQAAAHASSCQHGIAQMPGKAGCTSDSQ
jgi:hypothetical protein